MVYFGTSTHRARLHTFLRTIFRRPVTCLALVRMTPLQGVVMREGPGRDGCYAAYFEVLGWEAS